MPLGKSEIGNERQNICCAFSGILFAVELLEGKEHPCQAGPLEFEDLGGNTVGLLLRTIKIYFASGKYLILDSGLCDLKGLIKSMKKDVLSFNVIKKRR